MLLLGVIARNWFPPFRLLFIPSSVIAGFIGLAIFQLAPVAIRPQLDSLGESLSAWPSFLIAVIFAGMLLGGNKQRTKGIASRVGRQGLMVWIIVLGETTIGLLVTAILIAPFFDVPNSFGMLIETGFAGGHGTAGAMGDVFRHPMIAFPEGRDLGMLVATAGLIYGLVSGLLLINIGIRKGWASTNREASADNESAQPQPEEPNQTTNKSIGTARIGSDVIDPLLLQLIWDHACPWDWHAIALVRGVAGPST